MPYISMLQMCFHNEPEMGHFLISGVIRATWGVSGGNGGIGENPGTNP